MTLVPFPFPHRLALPNSPLTLMPRTDPSQWRVFNVLLRLLGIGATFSGLVALTTFGLGLPAPEGQSPAASWPSLLAGALVTLVGLGFLMIPPFRPDQGDTKVVSNPVRAWSGSPRRSWWTGDHLS
jgi:hypothetical protein